MEFIAPKHSKNRKRKRLNKNRRRNQRKLEVKLAKRRKTPRNNTPTLLTDNMDFHAMAADTFWENYKVAQDWQHRHSVAWWKSRCMALQHENDILRNKIRQQVHQLNCHEPAHQRVIPQFPVHYDNDTEQEDNQENIEFQVDDDMMKFLEQSIRHKMELKLRRERENEEDNEQINHIQIESGEVQDRNRIESAKLLYGSASSRIVAMETAVQVNVDRHKDRANPHYWPNIPLKP